MNVLFLMVDEMSWWALGHVTPAIQTPNIDRLAARSVRFTQAYTPSPICVPTRAAIATGKYLHELSNWSSAEPYDGTPRGWAHEVQNAGFDCVSIGKLHYRSVDDDAGFSPQIAPTHVVGGEGWVQALLRKPIEPDEAPDSLAAEIGPGDTDYHRYDRTVAQAAVDWLGEPDRQKRSWCAFVSLLAPHFPLKAPAKDFARYDAEALSADPEAVPEHPIVSELAGYFCHDQFFDRAARGVAKASYFALCTFVDRQVGRVLDALDAAGLRDDTLILFTSDHGEMLGEKGFWTKSNMYDSAARVPLLLAGPGVAPGQWGAPVSLIDIAPTICAAMGIEASYPGVDLRHPDPQRVVISEYHDGGCSVGVTMLRWDDWKLVHYAEGHPPQLFNLANDPREMRDLAKLEPDVLQDGYSRMAVFMDPEEVNKRAFQDQARRIKELGGPDSIRARGQFSYTPANA